MTPGRPNMVDNLQEQGGILGVYTGFNMHEPIAFLKLLIERLKHQF